MLVNVIQSCKQLEHVPLNINDVEVKDLPVLGRHSLVVLSYQGDKAVLFPDFFDLNHIWLTPKSLI